jgi:hypothetical protein
VSLGTERLERPFETASGTAELRFTSPVLPAEMTDPFGTVVEKA